jgi:hypothetical protein
LKKVHECKHMKAAEAWVEGKRGNWTLNINRVATESDLEENHYLEYVGQTIEHVALSILFCPYCGEELGQPKPKFVPSFQHNDFSKWRR